MLHLWMKLLLADVIDYMALYRPYRPALGINQALAEILKERSILFEEKVVDACLKLCREKKN